MRVAITGATGDIGSQVVRHLHALDWVSDLVVLGRRAPPRLPGDVRYVRWQLGDPWPTASLSDVDALIHSAFILEDTRQQKQAYDANVTGTGLLLSTAADAGVRHITFVSSANAYGLRSGPTALRETDPITDAPHHFYLHHKYLCEKHIRELVAAGSSADFAVARPCMVVGPGIDNTAISTLQARVITYPRPDHSRYQFVGVDDVAAALATIVADRAAGTFNLAPDDSLTVREIAELQGHRAVHVPTALARRLSDIGFALRLTPFSSRWVTHGDPVMAPDASRSVLGWEATRTSRAALLGIV